MAGAIFIPSSFLHFSFTLIEQRKKYFKAIAFCYIVSAIFLLLNFTTLFIKDVRPRLSFPYWPSAGIAYTPFIAMFIASTIYAHSVMYKYFKKLSGYRRNQIKYIFLGTALGFLGGSTNYFLWYDIPILPIGNSLVALYVLMIAYAILRYRLMDITLAISRTTIFILVYTPILGLPFLLVIGLKAWLMQRLGQWWWVSPLVLMFSLATIGPFIYIFLQRKAEERLLKEQRRYQNTLMQASLGMTRIRDLKKLIKLVVHIVSRTVRLNYASIYLLDRENTRYALEAVRTFKDKESNILPRIELGTPLVKYLSESGKPLVFEEMKRSRQDKLSQEIEALKEQMFLLNASVIVPSFIGDKLLGFMVLGDKLSGKIYSEDDLRVFTVLANHAALAIENARFFEDAKEMQEQISQAEKMATIGTMADGLSHQINNRFYALSLIAGDTLDTVKLTDITNYAPEQRELLSQIKHALERIQSNVLQGSEIVKGMLKYTRKGEEGFQAVRLDDIINSTLEMVQYKIKLSEIDIIRDYPKDTPALNGNLTQLQEVFFNLIDNAYDAIVERREGLKEQGYRGKIRIRAETPDSGYLKIKVEDNGLGAKEQELKKMFTPFFTTKISSRKGTGLGLYVIKKIITANHYGKINFESAYKQGTKFILELPLYAE
ncbi:MAG: hypothetical protein A3J51_01275 [Omnitrophica WOR_2 bacterium RIFCSPHIGHO2_02_FULL_45_21]|nr:MAG: hypothetical protein A3J51_01275 [Omnitrophica WOR_2 bacterium RIFCSPHIGHO2_02_FULL_45_21]